MKTMRFLSGALVCSMFMFASCDNNDNENGPGGVNKEIYSEFAKMYPGATDVEWNSNGTYAIVSFDWNGSRAGVDNDFTAWFDNSTAKFVMEEHDIPFASLPDTVKTGFNNSKYASWQHDDEVDVLKRLDKGTDTFRLYVIEVKQNGNGKEFDLYFDDSGLLVKEVPDEFGDNDFTDLLPTKPAGSVEAWVQEKYPNARIIDLDNDEGGIEVEFIYNNMKHEALLTKSNEWVYTKIDYNRDFTILPAKALDFIVYKHGSVSTYHELDIEKYDCADAAKNYFNVEIEVTGDNEFEYNFNTDGERIQKPDFSDAVGGGLTVEAAIQKVLDDKYPNAVVIKREYDDGLLELEISHEGIEKDVYFNGRNEWVRTEYDLNSNQLKEKAPKIIEYINTSSKYTGYRFEDAEVVENASGTTYEVEIEVGNMEYNIFFDKDGNFIKEIADRD